MDGFLPTHAEQSRSERNDLHVKTTRNVHLSLWKECNCKKYMQGRRNGFVIGGGGQNNFFFELHFHIERMRFCTLVNMWFTISTELKDILSLLTILLYTDLCVVIFKLLIFFGWQNIGNCPPPPPCPPPLFLRQWYVGLCYIISVNLSLFS